ncbi:heme-binding protein [Dechloromonas agitata]|nr:heme-binding protein [Dechloromonas agitata]MDE1546850.1 heme-binding protein [Dechloromonas agitata]
MTRQLTLTTLLIGLLWTGTLMATEEPKFESLRLEDNIEIRRYVPVIVAETFVDGDMDSATRRGFQRIADYIFGNNERIAMTVPVVAKPQDKAEKIAMTVPVSIEPQEAAATRMAGAQRWRIHFVMPSQYTLATLPKPLNPAIGLREIPARTYAVLTYSGSNTASTVQERTDQLLAWLQAQGIAPIGQPQLARYNPPWTLPFLRRNEIQQEIVWNQP